MDTTDTATQAPSLLSLARRIARTGAPDAAVRADALLAGAAGYPVGEIAWSWDAYSYVACVYGDDGDQPGDCYTRVGTDEAGVWWVDDGDDDDRVARRGPYWTEAAAIEAATELADELHEALAGEDTEAMVRRLADEAAARTSDDGEWMVAWVDPTGRVTSYHQGDRYADRDDAELAIGSWYDAVLAQTPTALTHLMRHPVLAARVDGDEWCVVAPDMDGRDQYGAEVA